MDNGYSMKRDKQPIFAEWAEQARFLAAEPHGELSVVDNFGNAIAKNNWTANRDPDAPEWVDTLNLLVEYDSLKTEAIQSMWTHNFLLDVPKLTRAAVDDLLKGNNIVEPKRARLFDDYRAAYHSFIAERDASGLNVFPQVDGEQLDGAYWKDNKINF